MIISSTGMVNILTIEIRDPLLRAYTSISLRAGESVSVDYSLRYSPEVIQAVNSGWATLTIEPKDDVSQQQIAGLTTQAIVAACSDELTPLAIGTAKITLRMPFQFTLTGIRASVTTAPTGAAITVDVKQGGVSILSTPITIDAGTLTSVAAAVQPVIATALLLDDAQMTVDVTNVGSVVAGSGLKVSLIGNVT